MSKAMAQCCFVVTNITNETQESRNDKKVKQISTSCSKMS